MIMEHPSSSVPHFLGSSRAASLSTLGLLFEMLSKAKHWHSLVRKTNSMPQQSCIEPFPVRYASQGPHPILTHVCFRPSSSVARAWVAITRVVAAIASIASIIKSLPPPIFLFLFSFFFFFPPKECG
uniref:Uncharacterized protein n=1 Tax=Opuntia streptacantha TaxID=393608 RepID=A0A7C8YQR0_OPUST